MFNNNYIFPFIRRNELSGKLKEVHTLIGIIRIKFVSYF